MAAKGVSTTAQPLESADYYRLIEYLERDKQYRWALFCIIACTMGLRVSDVKILLGRRFSPETCISSTRLKPASNAA